MPMTYLRIGLMDDGRESMPAYHVRKGLKTVRKRLRALLAVSAMLVSACGGVMQVYEGPKKPSNEVAILRTNVGELTFDTAWVDLVDGRNLIRAYSEVEILPGRHSLRIQLSSGILKASRTVSFEAQAGRAYRVRGSLRSGGTYAWIEDDRTREAIAGAQP